MFKLDNKLNVFSKFKINSSILAKNFLENFYKSYSSEDKLEQNNPISNSKIHSTKSFDGLILEAYEENVNPSSDYVLLIHDYFETVEDLEIISNELLKNNCNVIRIKTRLGLFNFSKTYLDIIVWLNYFKTIYPNNRFYLYGKGVGATMSSVVLKTNLNNNLNAVVLDNIELDILGSLLRKYCTENKTLYTSRLLKQINKLAREDDLDLTIFNVEDALSNNNIPIIFIEKNSDHKKQFLKFYNSNKAIKKMLYLENYDENNICEAYKKLCNALKSFN